MWIILLNYKHNETYTDARNWTTHMPRFPRWTYDIKLQQLRMRVAEINKKSWTNPWNRIKLQNSANCEQGRKKCNSYLLFFNFVFFRFAFLRAFQPASPSWSSLLSSELVLLTSKTTSFDASNRITFLHSNVRCPAESLMWNMNAALENMYIENISIL